MKTILCTTLFITLSAMISAWAVPSAFADEVLHAPPELAALIEEGLEANNDLRAMTLKVKAKRQTAVAAGALNDPMVGFALANLPTDSFEMNQDPMTQKQFFISQRVPWFGTLSLKEQRVALEAEVDAWNLAAERAKLAGKIADAWFRLGIVGKGLETNAELNEMVNQMMRVAETRYSTGKGLQQDILAAQVLQSELLDEKITLERERANIQSDINGMLNRPDIMKIEFPKLSGDPEWKSSTAELKDRLLKDNLMLKARSVAIEKAQTEVDLAESGYYPNMDFRVSYGQRDDAPGGAERSDLVSASVAFSVPIWQGEKQDRRLDAAEKNLEAARRAKENLKLNLPHKVDSIVADISAAVENHRLVKQALTVQAGQWAESSLAAYSVGKVEFETMINARMRLIKFELRADKLLYNIYRKKAELEELLGGTGTAVPAATIVTKNVIAEPESGEKK